MPHPQSPDINNALSPAARLPPNVIEQIVAHAAGWPWQRRLYFGPRDSTPGIPRPWSESIAIKCALIHRSWREPVKAVLLQRVYVQSEAQVDRLLESRLLESANRKETLVLGIYGKGTKHKKVKSDTAEQLLAQIGSPRMIGIKNITGLTRNSLLKDGLLDNLTHLEINCGLKALPKAVRPLVCPARIPLRSVILGKDAVPADLLRPLFAAAAPTLTFLRFVLTPATIPALTLAFPVIAPSIAQLGICANGWSSASSAFLPALSGCAKLRFLEWTVFEVSPLETLELALRELPAKGFEIEGLNCTCRSTPFVAQLLLSMTALGGLRLLMMSNAPNSEKDQIRKLCIKRGVVFEPIEGTMIYGNML